MNLSSFSFSWSNLCCSRSHLSISFCRFLSAISFACLALTRRVITSWASLRSWGQMFFGLRISSPKDCQYRYEYWYYPTDTSEYRSYQHPIDDYANYRHHPKDEPFYAVETGDGCSASEIWYVVVRFHCATFFMRLSTIEVLLARWNRPVRRD